ncbi:hypothetical protein EON65_20950 [archaeon]|nr:MAG: hypothetical protein EON65_20950 [archaeon]
MYLWVRDVARYLKAELKVVNSYVHGYKPSFILHVTRVVETDHRDPYCDKKKATIDVLKALIPQLTEADIAVIDGIYGNLNKSVQICGPSSLKILRLPCPISTSSTVCTCILRRSVC